MIAESVGECLNCLDDCDIVSKSSEGHAAAHKNTSGQDCGIG